MGNRASSSGSSDNGTGASPVAEDSGVYLSQDLQGKIIQDFQSTVLKEEWENQQRSILAAANKRVAEDEQRRVDLEKELAEFRARNNNVQAQLDAKIDSLTAAFADRQVEIQHDCSRLEKSIGEGPKFGEGNACLNARADLKSCFNEVEDVRKCDGFVKALERCVKKEVVSQ